MPHPFRAAADRENERVCTNLVVPARGAMWASPPTDSIETACTRDAGDGVPYEFYRKCLHRAADSRPNSESVRGTPHLFTILYSRFTVHYCNLDCHGRKRPRNDKWGVAFMSLRGLRSKPWQSIFKIRSRSEHHSHSLLALSP